LGDSLEKLNEKVNFEIFRKILDKNLSKLAKGKDGRPPCDYVLLLRFK